MTKEEMLAVSKIIKKHFNNLTVDQVIYITIEIIEAMKQANIDVKLGGIK